MPINSWSSFFRDKTVTQLGLGLLGRGVGDAAFLAQHCKKVLVTDLKSADDLRGSVQALRGFDNIEFCLGRHDYDHFADVDFVIKGAGVRLDNPYIAHAREHNVPIYMSTALFAHLSGLPLIGVTGTRGKTSTTCMIAEILQHAGKRVLIGGNIRGVSTLALLPDAANFDMAVLELDSWQLQGFDSLHISPNISVFTTLYPDHMNYYDGDMARYLYDKTAIFRHHGAGDTCVTTSEVQSQIEPYLVGNNYHGKLVIAQPMPPAFALQIPGAHNLLNAGLAQAATHLCGIKEHVINAALHAFTGVEGRLQMVGRWQDLAIYNDNNATTQEATLAAIMAFPCDSIVLIFGGADKGLPISHLTDYIAANNIRAVLLTGTGSERVSQELPNIPVVDSMQEAVNHALRISHPNDNIIFSPAFASFGMFKNEYDRNDQFMAELRKLVNTTNPC